MSTVSGEAAPATWSGVVTVDGYSKTKGVLGVGNSFNSTVIAVGGHGWRIEYYPDGYTQANAGWISFGLGLDRPADAADEEEDVKAEFAFSLLDEAGAPVVACTAASGVCMFSVRNPSWVFERIVERRDLESSPCLRDDDSFSVRCCVTIYTAKDNAATAAVPAAFAAMASAEVEEDVTMVIGVDDRKTMEEHVSTLIAMSLVGIDEMIYSLGE